MAIIGLVTADGGAISEAPNQWMKLKNKISDPTSFKEKQIDKHSKSTRGGTNSSTGTKAMSCKAFIINLSRTLSDKAFGEKAEDVEILPYDTELELYQQYTRHYSQYNKTTTNMPSESTFRRAYQTLSSKIKLRGSRGSFETCGICNHINDALKKVVLLTILF